MKLKEVLGDLLICPITKSKLDLLTHDEIAALPHSFSLLNNQPVSALLKAEESDIYYPILNGIIFLLPEHAIHASTMSSQHSQETDTTKASVQSFYNNLGWKAENGVYKDAKDSEDLREVCADYIESCHKRLKDHLPVKGRYLLDVASGPLQYVAYLSYSENYEYRICADISVTALVEAQKKLGDKGIYLLCDITQLPIQDNKIDAVVSLHTLYHVPANQQAKGFAELYRVLKSGGKSVIVYSWGQRSLLMNLFMFPFKLLSLLRRMVCTKYRKQNLYFYTHSYQWFCKEVKSKYGTELFSWRSVNVPFLKIFIHPYLGGRALLKIIAWFEQKYPQLMGRIGAYPLFVSVKK